MTDFYDKGDYHVKGDKWDECPAFDGSEKLEEFTWVSCFFALLMFVIITACLWNIDDYAARFFGVWGGTYLILCGITLFWIHRNSGKCGMAIRLYDRRELLLTRFYHFTNNPSYDAMKVAQMVKAFSLMADQKYLEDESKQIGQKLREEERKKKSEVCCIRYKEVIQKVKPDDPG